MSFIKTFFASLLAVVVGGIMMLVFGVIFFVGVMMAVGSSAFGMEESVTLTDNTVLKIDLANGVSEEPSKGFLYSTFGGFAFDNSNDILQVVRAIDQATWDSKVKGIYINIRYGSISAANLEELRAAVAKFKAESGKFVVAYSDSYSQTEYYFASVADRVYLNPEGNIIWKGLASNVMFYKKMLDKLGVEPEIIRHGKFKSAVEPFMLDRMSVESRMQTTTMLSSLWGAIVGDIAASREIDAGALDNYASALTIESACEAQEYGLVDGLMYEDEVLSLLNSLALGDLAIGDLDCTKGQGGSFDGIDEGARGFALQLEDEELAGVGETSLAEAVVAEDVDSLDVEELTESPDQAPVTFKRTSRKKEPQLMALSGYISHLQMQSFSSFKTPKNSVAVIYANGDIIDGEGPDGYVGGQTLSKKLAEARKDENIKAVVLRVNSPGGSALASEIIWREVELLKQEKPVVVSMGSMAASGGYYISCGADAILVDRMTITGSIGVFGVLLDAADALEDKLGITVDVVRTNPSGDFGSVFRGVSARERSVLQGNVDRCYDTFINHVADGRNMTLAQVDGLGEGRVWSGVNAVGNGLADGYGGVLDAVELAASRAGIEGNYEILPIVDQYDGISSIVSSLSGKQSTAALRNELGEAFVHYRAVRGILSQKGAQARMPYIIELAE